MSQHGRIAERKACLTLLTAALAFVAVQQLGGWALDRLWPHVRFVGLDALRRTAAEHKHEPVVAFFGSSRFGNGIVPEAIEDEWRKQGGASGRPVNFAAPASDLAAEEYVFNRLTRDGLRPRAIVVEVSPETFSRHRHWLNFHVARQMPLKEGLADLGELRRTKLLTPFLLGQALPLWKNRAAIRHELLREILDGIPERHPGLPNADDAKIAEWLRKRDDDLKDPLDVRIQRGMKTLRDWAAGPPYQVGGANLAAFRRLTAACRKAGIRLVLVEVPVTSPQRAFYAPAAVAAYERTLAEAQRKDPKLILLDARARFPDELFLDNHHLSPAGSEAFSRWLAAELRKAWDRAPPAKSDAITKK